ncbi:hypothetical protein LWE69_19165 [Paenibacillus sp. UKAQ_18]|nr:hypothetical protein [Paenibacillus sp. UKAQ_18]
MMKLARDLFRCAVHALQQQMPSQSGMVAVGYNLNAWQKLNFLQLSNPGSFLRQMNAFINIKTQALRLIILLFVQGWHPPLGSLRTSSDFWSGARKLHIANRF